MDKNPKSSIGPALELHIWPTNMRTHCLKSVWLKDKDQAIPLKRWIRWSNTACRWKSWEVSLISSKATFESDSRITWRKLSCRARSRPCKIAASLAKRLVDQPHDPENPVIHSPRWFQSKTPKPAETGFPRALSSTFTLMNSPRWGNNILQWTQEV